MNHFTTPSFWDNYENLPVEIQKLADKNFELLKQNTLHPSLHSVFLNERKPASPPSWLQSRENLF